MFDGFFTPLGKKLDTKAKQILTLSGGLAVSLLLFPGLMVLRFAGFSFQSDALADGVSEFFLNFALFTNLYILFLFLAPVHYFHG